MDGFVIFAADGAELLAPQAFREDLCSGRTSVSMATAPATIQERGNMVVAASAETRFDESA